MRKIKSTWKKNLLLLFTIINFVISPSFFNVKADGELDLTDPSITTDMRLIRGRNNNFSGSLIDPDNITRNFDSGVFQTQKSGFDEIFNDSLTDLNNSYQYIPNSNDFELNKGAVSWNDNLTALDGIGTNFTSTDTEFGGVYTFDEYATSSLGYHYGEWSFDGEVGKTGGQISWANLAFGSAECVVEQTKVGHETVLRINGNIDGYHEYTNFPLMTSGTIEFWLLTDASTSYTEIEFWDESGYGIFELILNSGNMTSVGETMIMNNNQWYHIKFEFEQTAGSYKGLGEDTCNFYVDGVTIASAVSIPDRLALEHIFLRTNGAGKIWIDAYGDSSDPNYHETHSQNPYDVTTDLTSDNFDFVGEFTNYISVVDDSSDHANVIKMGDSTNQEGFEFWYDFESAQGDETIEFWVKNSDATRQFYIWLRDGETECVGLRFNNDELRVTNGVGWGLVDTIINNQWYHVRIDFRCSIDDFDFFLDDVEFEEFGNLFFDGYPSDIDSIDNLHIELDVVETGYSVYFDALGFSWDSEYIVGENLALIDPILNFTIDLELGDFDYEFYNLNWGFNSTESDLVNFSQYNFNTSSWEVINSSDYNLPIYENSTFSHYNSTFLVDYLNETNWLLFKIESSSSSLFNLFLDYFKLDCRNYVNVSITKKFESVGDWRYRFNLNSPYGSPYISDWTYFSVYELEHNVELISESEYITKWNFGQTTDEFINIHNESFESYTWGDWNLFEDTDNGYMIVDSLVMGDYLSDDYYYNYTSANLTGWWLPTERVFISGVTGSDQQTMCWDGSYLWVGTGSKIYKYSLGLSYQSVNYNMEIGGLECVRFIDSHFYTLEDNTTNQYIVRYDSSWNYLNKTEITGMDDYLRAFILHDNFWYILGDDANTVWKLYRNFTDTGTSFSIGGEGGNPRNMVYWSGYFWIVEDELNRMNKYDLNFVYQDEYMNIGGVDSSPRDYIWADDRSFMIGSANKKIQRMRHNLQMNNTIQLDSYLAIQTEETETFSFRSLDNLDLVLYENDFIEIQFNTTSTNRIGINLLNGGITEVEFELSVQGNENFNTRNVSFTLSNQYDIDQIEFTGIFDATKNLKIMNISVNRYLTTIETHYVDPDGTKLILLDFPLNYSVFIYEENSLIEVQQITTSENITVILYEINRIVPIYISYFDPNNNPLDFSEFTLFLTYTLDEIEYTNKRIAVNQIFVDSNSLIQYEVFDSFNVSIKSGETYEETFVDIVLDIYSLKIKNEATEYVNYTIESSSSGIIKEGNIFSEEIIEFNIATGNYEFNYTNNEDAIFRSFTIELETHTIISINSTLNTVYFAMFTYDGLGINPDIVRFYLDGERRDFGFNTILTDTVNYTILDFFNNTLATEIISVDNISEYNIFIEIYTMNIMNQFTYEDIIVNITQVGSEIYMIQVIPKQFGIFYRFIPNINYSIEILFTNLTIYDSRIVNLTENNQIESFGTGTEFPEIPEIPEYPKDVYFGLFSIDKILLRDEVKFYIDNSRADFGFNTIELEIVNLKVLDYFNSTLYDQDVNISGIYEFDIFIEVYNMIIYNNYSHPIIIELERASITIESFIEFEGYLNYRLFPNLSYEFTILYTNGTEIVNKTITLDEDNLLVVFGFYEGIFIPTPIDYQMDIILGVIFALVIGIGLAVLYYRYKRELSSPGGKPKKQSRRKYDKSIRNEYF